MPTTKRDIYTKEQRTRAISLYREGKSLSEIAAVVKIGVGTLYRVLHKHKVPLRSDVGSKTKGTATVKAKPETIEPPVDTSSAEAPKSLKVTALKAKLKDAMEMNNKLKSLIVKMMLEKA